MSRNKKPRAERLCAPITFTGTPEQVEMIKDAAKQAGEFLSPFCRTACLTRAARMSRKQAKSDKS